MEITRTQYEISGGMLPNGMRPVADIHVRDGEEVTGLEHLGLLYRFECPACQRPSARYGTDGLRYCVCGQRARLIDDSGTPQAPGTAQV